MRDNFEWSSDAAHKQQHQAGTHGRQNGNSSSLAIKLAPCKTLANRTAPPTSFSTVTIYHRLPKAKHKQNLTYKTDAGSTLYGFNIKFGSIARLIDPISAIASTDLFRCRYSGLHWPTPCSALIEPEARATCS